MAQSFFCPSKKRPNQKKSQKSGESCLTKPNIEGKIITNIDNLCKTGGFIALNGAANVEFKVNGTLNIGNGNGKDSFASVDDASKKTIRKTGAGTMTINAPVSDYKGTWTVEDGVLNMNYGGSIAGPITVNGGRMNFSRNYTFTTLVIGLDPTKKDAYIGGATRLSGGKYCIVIENAIPEGSYLLAEDANGFNAQVTVQTKDGKKLGTLVVGRETKIHNGTYMLKLDGGTLSLSVLASIDPAQKANASQEKQPSNPQPPRDPNLRKTVTKSTRGNVTTETVTEYNGDTTIETVTTTEVNGDTTTTTTTTTETKNGKVVKRTSTTTTTTTEKSSDDQANFDATGIIHLPGGVELKMVKVEAGTFTMSAKDGDNRYWEIAHQATIEKDFYLAKTEVTQAQWKAVMNSNPSGFKGDDLPVETVSWNDAMAFCEKLNKSGKAPSGWMFSLPTETQWEYAARGGNQSKGYKYSGSNNLDEVAWYYENSGDERLSDSAWSEDRLSSNHCKTHPVGTKKANELGLYDMSGNLYEWCLDDWREDRSDRLTAEFTRGNDSGGYPRSARGGGWGGSFINNRLSERGKGPSDFRKNDLGFRVALVQTDELAKVSNQDKTENTDNKTSSSSGTTPKKNNPTYNPFGYTSPLMEDD